MKNGISREVVRRVYGEGARNYEEVMSRYWEFDRQKLVDDLELAGGERVLEIGVGTGKNLPHYPQGTNVVGIDFTPGMLEIAKQKQLGPIGAVVTLLEMDAEQMTFSGNEFDAALESFVLCVAPDPAGVLREAVRVTRPGSRIAIFDYCLSRDPEIVKWQKLIATAARTIGFPPGVIVWDPLRDYEEIIRTTGLPLGIVKNQRFENSNPFLLACSMLLRNEKGSGVS